jgi:SAM-dependent methyltransferase
MKIGRLAPFYRWIEYAAFGRALERRRFALLDRLSGARRVLILGEGDGRALEKLLKIAPQARFDVVESSAEMIALAQTRTGTTDRVRYFCQDVRQAGWPIETYDGIVTFFFLDCFSDRHVKALVKRLKQSLVPGGVWLVTDFRLPAHGWRRWHAIYWVHLMYRFFRFSTGLRTKRLPLIEKILAEAGLERIDFRTERAGLMFSSAWTRSGIVLH